MKKLIKLLFLAVFAASGWTPCHSQLTNTFAIRGYLSTSLSSECEIARTDGTSYVVYNRLVNGEGSVSHHFFYKHPNNPYILGFNLPDPTYARQSASYEINDLEVVNGYCYFCGSICRLVSGQPAISTSYYDNFGIVGMFDLSDPATTIQVAEIRCVKKFEKIAAHVSGQHIYAIGVDGVRMPGAMSTSYDQSLLVDISICNNALNDYGTQYCMVTPVNPQERFVDVASGSPYGPNLVVASRIIGSHLDFGIRLSKESLDDDDQISHLSNLHVFEAEFYDNAAWNDDIDRVLLAANADYGFFAAYSNNGNNNGIAVRQITGSWDGLTSNGQYYHKNSYTKLNDLTLVCRQNKIHISTISTNVASGTSELNYTYANRFVDLWNNSHVRYYNTNDFVLKDGRTMLSAAYFQPNSLLVVGRNSDGTPIYFFKDPTTIDNGTTSQCAENQYCYQIDYPRSNSPALGPVQRVADHQIFSHFYTPNINPTRFFSTNICNQ